MVPLQPKVTVPSALPASKDEKTISGQGGFPLSPSPYTSHWDDTLDPDDAVLHAFWNKSIAGEYGTVLLVAAVEFFNSSPSVTVAAAMV